MSSLLPFIVLGLATGSVYGLAGVGLVLTYRTSGVFNFAHGAMATVAAYVFYSTTVLHGWATVPAAFVAIVVLGPLMGLLLEFFARRLQLVELILQVAGTIGLLLIVEAGVVLLYGDFTVRQVLPYFPSNTVQIAGAYVQFGSIATFVLTTAAVVALSLYLKRARRGIAMLAVVDNPELLALSATSPVATRRLAWVIGSTLAAASGVIFAPLVPLDPSRLTLLVVAALGAAALGSFRSLPLTFAGGLAVGVLAALSTKWFTTGPLIGLAASVPFVILFVVLLVFPRRRLVTRSHFVSRRRPSWRAPAGAQLTLGAACLVALMLVPGLVGFNLAGWTSALAMSVVLMSLSLLVRMSGQVSLCHVTFMAIGAVTLSHLTQGQHLPWGIALVLAGLVAVPVGAILSIPAIRLTGLYLALATLGFGVLVQSMFYTQDYFFGNTGAGLTVPRPDLALDDTPYYYLVLAIAAICALVIAGISRGRLGRLLQGLADSPAALETSGATVRVTRVLAFCISAFLAAIGGALWSAGLGSASTDSFSPLLSLELFALVVILVGGGPWDALVGGFFYALIPVYLPSTAVAHYMQLLFGVSAVLFAVMPPTAGDFSKLHRIVDRLARRKPRATVGASESETSALVNRLTVSDDQLKTSDIQVRYGGVAAVDGLSIEVPTGRITGLIGPNGAGKTTTFNACSGLTTVASGDITMGHLRLSRLSIASRARHGLGRTFQRMQLFESLTVAENVGFGAESAMAGANPLRHILARRGERRRIQIAIEHAIELCGLQEFASSSVATLPTGQRRLVELARCLAGEFKILLLDEPSSGLDQTETRQFGEILRRVVRERNIGVLLVEHDMSLVLSVCERIYVLDFGKLIYEGTPHEVSTSPVVQAVYLGEAHAGMPDDPSSLVGATLDGEA